MRSVGLVAAAFLALCGAAAADAPQPALVPYPAHLTLQAGEFSVDAATPIVFDKADAPAAAYLVDLLRRSRGITLHRRRGVNAITLRRDPRIGGAEAYRLDVTPPWRDDLRQPQRRPVLRHDHAVAAPDANAGQGAARGPSRPAYRRCPALRLAQPAARFGAPFPVGRLHQVVPRCDGAREAQRPAMAPDRRSGLAAGDQEISAASRASVPGASPPAGRATSIPKNRQAAPLWAASTPRRRCARSSPMPLRATSPSCPKSRCPATPWPPLSPIRASARSPTRRAPCRAIGACSPTFIMSTTRPSPSSKTC